MEDNEAYLRTLIKEIKGGKRRSTGDSCNGSGSESGNMGMQYSYPPKLVPRYMSEFRPRN